jgi:hypothetical protein
MFQTINKWLNTSYDTLVKKNPADVLKIFIDKKKGCASTFLFPELVDFREVTITDNTIEILRTPGTFTPFRSHGKIKFHLLQIDKKSWTKVKCEILPGNNAMPYILTYQLSTTGALAIGWLLLGRDTATKVVGALMVLILPVIISYVQYRKARTELTDYSRALIKLIRTENGPHLARKLLPCYFFSQEKPYLAEVTPAPSLVR